MTTQQVANQLVNLCRQGKIDEVQATLFAPTANSIEANDMMGARVVEGLEAIKAKSVAFQSGVEQFHGSIISEPLVAGDCFAINWVLDATFRERGRMRIEELCVYQVKEGKNNPGTIFLLSIDPNYSP